MIKRIKESYNRKQLRDSRREKRLILDKLHIIEFEFLVLLFNDREFTYDHLFKISLSDYIEVVKDLRKFYSFKYYEVNENYFSDTYKSKI